MFQNSGESTELETDIDLPRISTDIGTIIMASSHFLLLSFLSPVMYPPCSFPFLSTSLLLNEQRFKLAFRLKGIFIGKLGMLLR